MEDKNKSGFTIGGVVFAGCMFLGGGIGMVYDSVPTGGAIGIGVGFICLGAIWAYYKNK